MKEINTVNRLGTTLEENENVTDITYRNMGDSTQGMSVTFKNDIVMSILSGEFAYGNEQSPFEIAFLDKRNEMEWMPEIFDANDAGDDVAGYMSAEDVNYYIKQVIAFRA